MAGNYCSVGVATRRAASIATRRADKAVADFDCALVTRKCEGRNCLKLWSQSTSRRFATIDSMIVDVIPTFADFLRLRAKCFCFAEGVCCVIPSASAMRKLLLLLAALVTGASLVRGEIKTPEKAPIEITSTGQTTYEAGLATARGNVAIHVGDTDIYADYAQYNTTTHEVELHGNVRIYRGLNFYTAESGVYNIDTKQLRATNAKTVSQPYFLSGEGVTTISENAYRITNGTFTTHDSSKPDFHIRAHTIRVYENDRVIFQNVTLYIGRVPVFWWPYMYQSLNDSFSFLVSPAYLSSWGPSLLTQVSFPITEQIRARLRLDYRGRRGLAVGLDSTIDYGKDDSSTAKIRSYYIQVQNPNLN